MRFLRPIPVLAAVLLCALAAHGSAGAQVSAVQPGQRVRLTLSARPDSIEGHTRPQVLRGEVTQLAGDSLWLVLHPGTGPTRVTLNAVKSFEVSSGVEEWWEASWRQGRKSALLFGLELFLFRLFSDKPFDNVFEAGIFGAGIGMTAGAIMGAIQPQEVLQPLPWPPETPARHGR